MDVAAAVAMADVAVSASGLRGDDNDALHNDDGDALKMVAPAGVAVAVVLGVAAEAAKLLHRF